jgi:hypothetical protein
VERPESELFDISKRLHVTGLLLEIRVNSMLEIVVNEGEDLNYDVWAE